MTPTPQLAARRRAIHAAARQLGLSEDDRRALIAGQCPGKNSTTALNLVECDRVLNHMRKAGAARTGQAGEKYIGRHPGYPETCRPGCGDLMQKVEAQLADMRLPWAYAVTILKHVSAKGAKGRVGVDRLEWARPEHLKDVIAALDYEQQKREGLEKIDKLLGEHGLTRAWVEDLLREHAPEKLAKWTRTIKTLHWVHQVLAESRP